MENTFMENYENSAPGSQADGLKAETADNSGLPLGDMSPSLLSLKESPPDQNTIRQQKLAPIQSSFLFFGGLSLAFGVMFTFCLFENPCGITYPLFTVFACFCGLAACRKLRVAVKRGSWFLIGTAILIGASTCRTADPFLVHLNGVALVLLGCVFAIHQFYDDCTWNIGKYLSSVFLYLCQCAGSVPVPFRHLQNYVGTRNNKALKHLPAILAGFAAAVPVLALLVTLLSAADPVFSRFIGYVMGNILHPMFLAKLFLWTLFGTLALYCLVCGCCLHRLSENNQNRARGSSLGAIAGLLGIALVYLIFSVIQIVYLFLGKGTLPEDYTYSEYARQGFFQLLAVSFFNLVMVLCSLKYIRPHRILNQILTLICGCTYILIASAAWRVILYVQEYHLSYLRLLCLWFLCLLAVLMAGVTWIIWNRRFPLFGFCLTAVSVFYVALAWARPDSVVAWDHVRHLDGQTATPADLFYLTRELGADGAPAVASLNLDSLFFSQQGWDEDFDQMDQVWLNSYYDYYYDYHYWPECEEMGLRNYNFSFAQAKRLFPGS